MDVRCKPAADLRQPPTLEGYTSFNELNAQWYSSKLEMPQAVEAASLCSRDINRICCDTEEVSRVGTSHVQSSPHMLPDALLLLWWLLLLLTVQLLMQLSISLPQITQPSLHLHEHVCVRDTVLAEMEGSSEQCR